MLNPMIDLKITSRIIVIETSFISIKLLEILMK